MTALQIASRKIAIFSFMPLAHFKYSFATAFLFLVNLENYFYVDLHLIDHIYIHYLYRLGMRQLKSVYAWLPHSCVIPWAVCVILVLG